MRANRLPLPGIPQSRPVLLLFTRFQRFRPAWGERGFRGVPWYDFLGRGGIWIPILYLVYQGGVR